MDAEIGKISMGLLTPTATVENFKLYNSPDFGGTPFLKISELHIEYDRAALARHEIHVILARFNLDEFDIVKNEAGQTNIFPAASRCRQNSSWAPISWRISSGKRVMTSRALTC